MKNLVSMIVALGIAVAFTAPAFAGATPTIATKEDCDKAGKKWDDAGKKCELGEVGGGAGGAGTGGADASTLMTMSPVLSDAVSWYRPGRSHTNRGLSCGRVRRVPRAPKHSCWVGLSGHRMRRTGRSW